MKFNYFQSLILCSILILSSNLFAQDADLIPARDFRFTVELRGGINNSDLNYGIEALRNQLPLEDYNMFVETGDNALGYSFGIGGATPVGKRFTLFAYFDYLRYNHDASISVSSYNGSAPNPMSPNVATRIFGTVGYQYLNIDSGIRFHFNKDRQKGLFIGAFIGDVIHLKTDWTLDVEYQDGNIATDVDFSNQQGSIEFEDPLFIGANIGYQVKVSDRFSVIGTLDYRHGLWAVVESDVNILNPTAINCHIHAAWMF